MADFTVSATAGSYIDAALVAARDKAYAAGGGRIVVPPPAFKLKQSFVLNQNIPVHLDFQQGSQIIPDPNVAAVMRDCPGLTASDDRGGKITGLTVQHWGQPGLACALMMVNAGKWTVDGVRSLGAGGCLVLRNDGIKLGPNAFSEENWYRGILAGSPSVGVRFEVINGANSSFEGTRMDATVLAPTVGLSLGAGVSMAATRLGLFRVLATGGATCADIDADIGGMVADFQLEGLRGTGNVAIKLGANVSGHTPTTPPHWSGMAKVSIEKIGKAWATDPYPRKHPKPLQVVSTSFAPIA